MKQGSLIKSILKWLNHYFIFFLLVAFVITCCTMLFVSTLRDTLGLTLTGENISAAAKLTFWNVALLSFIFTLIDAIRRKVTIERPVKNITAAAEKIIEGDFSVRIKPQSRVGADESLSSTGSYEASYIAAEVLTGLSHVGCRCLFSTHLHELSGELERINEQALAEGGVRIDTLVAGIMGEGKRSFKIVRAKPDGKSYARDIAQRYGLTFDSILEKISK